MSNTKSSESLGPIEELHTAYIIDADGNEVPITQDMIDEAADKLEQPKSEQEA